MTSMTNRMGWSENCVWCVWSHQAVERDSKTKSKDMNDNTKKLTDVSQAQVKWPPHAIDHCWVLRVHNYLKKDLHSQILELHSFP